jgi:hypothetical protein
MDPDPTPDPSTFFIDFKDAKNIFIFFYNLSTGTSSSDQKILFFSKFLCKNFILQALFQSSQHIYEKREGSGSGSLPMTNGSGSRRSKNMQILRIRIPNTAF